MFGFVQVGVQIVEQRSRFIILRVASGCGGCWLLVRWNGDIWRYRRGRYGISVLKPFCRSLTNTTEKVGHRSFGVCDRNHL